MSDSDNRMHWTEDDAVHDVRWQSEQGLPPPKKVVIADRLSVFVDTVYDHPNDYHGFQTILATVFFSFQIYLLDD